MLNEIVIRFIPHEEQRYDTCGDWQIEHPRKLDPADELARATRLVISVSKSRSYRSNFAIAIHELVEALLCMEHGVTGEEVDQFDMAWTGEKSRVVCFEPGDDPAAPYYNEHQIATTVERIVVEAFGMPWHYHNENLESLPTHPKALAE